MASSYNQADALEEYLIKIGATPGQNIPTYSKARDVIAFSVPVEKGVINASDISFAEIDMNTKRGKIHGALIRVFNSLVENAVDISRVIRSDSVFATVEKSMVTPGTLNVEDFIDVLGRIPVPGESTSLPSNNGFPVGGGRHRRRKEARKGKPMDALSLFQMQANDTGDVYEEYNGGCEDSGMGLFDDGNEDEEAREDWQEHRDPYVDGDFLAGLDLDNDPLVEIYIETTYGNDNEDDEALQEERGMISGDESHMESNRAILMSYERALNKERGEHVARLRERLKKETDIFINTEDLIERTSSGKGDEPSGYGIKNGETLQCITVWFVCSSLISLWSILKNMVKTTHEERGTSSKSNVTYGVRRDVLTEVARNTEGSDITSQETDEAATMAALLMARADQGSFDMAALAGGGDKDSTAPRKIILAKPRGKSDRVSQGSEMQSGLPLDDLNALVNDYTVYDVDRSRKGMEFRAGVGIMNREVNGDLDPAIAFSPIDAVSYHGNSCHPLQSKRMFAETNGGTYFVGGFGRRCPQGFQYLRFPVPELVTRINPTRVKENYLIQCQIPKACKRLAPVLGDCHDLVDDVDISSIHIDGVVPPEASLKVANRVQQRASKNPVEEFENSRHTEKLTAMKRRLYQDKGVVFKEDSLDTASPKNASESVLPFDMREIDSASVAAMRTDSDSQKLIYNVKKCVRTVEKFLENKGQAYEKKAVLMEVTRKWAAEKVFEGVSAKRKNPDSIVAVYHAVTEGSLAGKAPLKANVMTDSLPPISDFLARHCAQIGDSFSSTEAHKVIMFFMAALACFRADEEVNRRPSMHMMGPGGGGKGVIIAILKMLCNEFIDKNGKVYATLTKLGGFSEKAFQSKEEPYVYDRSIVAVEELERKKIKNQDEGGGASATFKNMLTSNRTKVLVNVHDANANRRYTMTVYNWVRITWIVMDNGNGNNLEKAINDRLLQIHIDNKEDTVNDITRAMAESAFKDTRSDNKSIVDRVCEEFKQMQAAVVLIEDQIAAGAISPISLATAIGIVTGIFAVLKKQGTTSLDGRMLENITSYARSLCICEFFEAEFKRPAGQFYGKPITAKRIQAANWSLTIKVHHVIAALGAYAPYMFPQGQEQFRLAVREELGTRIRNICANNKIDSFEDLLAFAVENGKDAGSACAGFLSDEDEAAIVRVIKSLCPYQPQMRELAHNAQTLEDVKKAFNLNYVMFPENSFVSTITNIIYRMPDLEKRPSTNAIQNLIWTLPTHLLKVKPMKVGTSAFKPIVEDASRATVHLPIITNDVPGQICVLLPFLNNQAFGMESLVRSIKIAFNNSTSPRMNCIFSPGLGATYRMIAIGNGLGPDSVTLEDADVRVDEYTGEPIGEVSKAAHLPLVIPNYLFRIAPSYLVSRVNPQKASVSEETLGTWDSACEKGDAAIVDGNYVDLMEGSDEEGVEGMEPRSTNAGDHIDDAIDEEEEEDWSRFSYSRSEKKVGMTSTTDNSLSSDSKKKHRWVEPTVAKSIANAAVLLCSWDEFAREMRAEEIGSGLVRMTAYDESVASKLSRTWLEDKDCQSTDPADDSIRRLSELVFGGLDQMFAQKHGAEHDREALLINVLEEDDLCNSIDSLMNIDFGSGDDEMDVDDEDLDLSDHEDERGTDRPVRSSRTAEEEAVYKGLVLEKKFSEKAIIIQPTDVTKDSRIDKHRMMVKPNPCHVSNERSSSIYNPRTVAPLWCIIPTCTSFEDYFKRIFSTHVDHHYRMMAFDPLYGTRDQYPHAIHARYRARDADISATATNGTFLVVGGGKKHGSAIGKRVRRTVGFTKQKAPRKKDMPDDEAPVSFKGVLHIDSEKAAAPTPVVKRTLSKRERILKQRKRAELKSLVI